MPRQVPKFVSQYLIPSLNSERFGEHLMWVDKDNLIFQLEWRHKGGTKWSVEEAEVFVEWDKIKGHYKPNSKQYFTQSKQRFRSVLYKLTQTGQLIKLKSDNKCVKLYAIGKKKNGKRKKNLDVPISECDDNSSDETLSDEVDCDDLIDHSILNNFLKIHDDHNYSLSETEDEIYLHSSEKASQIPLHVPENYGKKVLAERNASYSPLDMMLDFDSPPDTIYGINGRTMGKAISLTSEISSGYHLKNGNENEMPLWNADTNFLTQCQIAEMYYLNVNPENVFADCNPEELLLKLLE